MICTMWRMIFVCVNFLVMGCLFIFAGGGVEPESHYPQWKRVNQGIERYPALIDSIAKLAEGMYIHNNKKQKCSFHVLKTNGVKESDKNKLMCMEIFWLNGSA